MADDTTQTADTTSQTTSADTTQQTTQVADTTTQTTTTQTADTTQQTTADTTTQTTAADDAAKGKWPDDWRQQMVRDSGLTGEEAEKTQRMLERFTSPAELAKSVREKDKFISSGKLKEPLPENPTPEQLSAWRKQNNIPEAATAYLENLPNGLIIGDTDKPFVEKVVAEMHELNIPVAGAHRIIAKWQETQDQLVREADEQIATMRRDTEESLRSEWGGEYQLRQTQLKNWTATLPKDIQQTVLDTSAANKQFAKLFVEMANTLNPAAMILPQSGFTSVGDEKAALKKTMSERDLTKEEHARYVQLVAQEQRLNGQG